MGDTDPFAMGKRAAAIAAVDELVRVSKTVFISWCIGGLSFRLSHCDSTP